MKIKTILLFALAAVVLVGCQKETTGDSTSGKPAYAKFSLYVTGDMTKTPATDNGVAEESTVSSLLIAIFSGGDLEKIETIDNVVDNVAQTEIKTTFGPKSIIAVTNASFEITNKLPTSGSLEDFKKALIDGTKLASSGSFVMVGQTDATITSAHTEAVNALNVTISVNRIVAKVSLRYNKSTVKITESRIASVEGIPTFTLAQRHKSSYLIRTVASPTPNGEDLESSRVDANGDRTYDHLEGLAEFTADGVKWGVSVEEFDGNLTHSNSVYCAENINIKPTKGNSTFAMIKVKVVPALEVGDAVHADGSFWTVAKDGSTRAVYGTEAAAIEYSNSIGGSAAGLEVLKYTEGYCYYRLDIRNKEILAEEGDFEKLSAKYSVLANYVYKINIVQLIGFGGHNEDSLIPDPDMPSETTGHIEATVFIEPWNVLTNNEMLG